jgi:transglutaminase-like putative cysteine protease
VLLELTFETTYSYQFAALGGVTALRLRPAVHPGVNILRAGVDVSPGARTLSYRDGWGTEVDVVELAGKHELARFEMHTVVETLPQEYPAAPPAPHEVFVYSADSGRVRVSAVAALGWSMLSGELAWPSVESVLRWFPQRFVYQVGATDASTPVEVFLEQGSGVCQDFAHALLALLRSWGWCARYVSGYMFTGDEGSSRIEAEAMHAWVEVYRPGFGWVGLDPTTGDYTDERYVPVGRGRDYDDVRPIRGVIVGGGMQQQSARLTIQAIGGQQ